MRKVFVLLLLTAQSLWAQKPIELGLDPLGLALTFIDADLAGSFTNTSVFMPNGRFRIGFFASDVISIEPVLSLNFEDLEDVGSAISTNALLTALFHFTKDRTKPQGYVRPGVGVSIFDTSESDAQGQVSTGVGVGVKLPIGGVDRLLARIEGFFNHAFKNDNVFGSNSILVLFGLSFLTK
jgi:hypothetical protein